MTNSAFQIGSMSLRLPKCPGNSCISIVLTARVIYEPEGGKFLINGSQKASLLGSKIPSYSLTHLIL